MRISRILMVFVSGSVLAHARDCPGRLGVGDRPSSRGLVTGRCHPDLVGVGPQITTCMKPPVTDDSTAFVAFNLNYRDSPSFRAGGLQLQVCSDGRVSSTSTLKTDQLATANESITWTQQISLSSGKLKYEVLEENRPPGAVSVRGRRPLR